MSELIKLSTISKIKGGTGFPEKYQGNKSAEYPVVKVSEMEIEGNKKYIKVANNYLDQKTAILLNATIFPKDTIVFAKVGAALLLNRRRILSRESILDNNMMGLIVASEVNVNFLYQFLLTFDLGMLVQTGALPSVNQQIVGNIEILLPPLPQQLKIAKILTTVDNLIEKTEALIAKYQSIKHGMMHDLFTRGIDAKGELRPQQSEGMSNQKACLKDLVFNDIM